MHIKIVLHDSKNEPYDSACQNSFNESCEFEIFFQLTSYIEQIIEQKKNS